MATLSVKSYATTGAMSASSTTLIVASNPGFQIGDNIIVEIGGEAGLGLRGSVGVGGTWPTKSYANTATMVADTTQADDTLAWLVNSGFIYQYDAGSTIWTIMDAGLPYLRKACPKALTTTITNIAGTTFTLADPSVAATTNANVYYDNAPYLCLIGSDNTPPPSGWPVGEDMIIPAGSFAMGHSWRLGGAVHDGLVIQGQGAGVSELFSPDGCISTGVMLSTIVHPSLSNFSIRGNCGDDRYGLFWDVAPVLGGYGPILTETGFSNLNEPWGFGIGITATGDPNAWTVENIDVYDHFRPFVCGSTDIRIRNCRSIRTAGMLQYIQWDFQVSGNTLVEDCIVDSPHLVPGFEAFLGNGAIFRRPVGRNAVCSFNSSVNCTLEDMNMTIEANSERPEFVSFNWADVAVSQTNQSIQPGTGSGGSITNPRITVEGYIDGVSKTMRCFDLSYVGMTMTGGYPCSPQLGGLLQVPTTASNRLINIDGSGTGMTITGIRFVGATNQDFQMVTAADTVVTDCVIDTYRDSTNDGLNPYFSEILSNAQFLAGEFTCPVEPTTPPVTDSDQFHTTRRKRGSYQRHKRRLTYVRR